MCCVFPQDAKAALVSQQDDLKEMMASLEKDKEMGLAQKQELLDEIEKKRAEIEESRALVDSKEEETQQLRQDMEEANVKLQVSSSYCVKVFIPLTRYFPKIFVEGKAESAIMWVFHKIFKEFSEVVQLNKKPNLANATSMYFYKCCQKSIHI